MRLIPMLLAGAIASVVARPSTDACCSGPTTWAHAVCEADAAVTLEVSIRHDDAGRLLGVRAQDVKVVETHFDISGAKGFRFRDVSFLEAVHGFALVSQPGDPPELKQALASRRRQVQAAGVFRVVAFLDYAPEAKSFDFSPMGVQALGMESATFHPRHGMWRRHIMPMIKERVAATKKRTRASFCPPDPEPVDWSSKRAEIEEAWFDPPTRK